MSLRIFEDQGAAELNKIGQIGRVESLGPITMSVLNRDDDANTVISFDNEVTKAQVFSDKDTKQTAEATAYVGNGATTTFTGQALNVLPAIPKSLSLTPATSGPVLFDRDGDSKLYTQDVDEDFSGTVDYFTGALELEYPVGKEPDGAITADYWSQDESLVPRGRRSYGITTVKQDEAIRAFAAADEKTGAPMKLEAVGIFI